MTVRTPVIGVGRRAPAGRVWARIVVLAAVSLVVGVGLAGPAAAHNVLIASDPADGATLQQPPTVVSLTFDQPVQDFQPVVTILGADGQRYESGSPAVDSTVVTQQLTAVTTPGTYTIAYRVVSADGHPVQGELRFDLAAAPTPAPPVPPTIAPSTAPSSEAGPSSGAASESGAGSSGSLSSSAAVSTSPGSSALTPTSSTIAAPAPTGSSSGLTGWVWAAIAVAAALVATAVVVIVRRPRQSAGRVDPE